MRQGLIKDTARKLTKRENRMPNDHLKVSILNTCSNTQPRLMKHKACIVAEKIDKATGKPHHSLQNTMSLESTQSSHRINYFPNPITPRNRCRCKTMSALTKPDKISKHSQAQPPFRGSKT